MRWTEEVVGIVRQLPVRGKGRLFDSVVPRSGTRDAEIWGRYRMSLDLADVVQRQMYLGCFGFEISQALRRLLPREGVFLDVGAHVGYFSLLAAHIIGPYGRVFAVEPNPAIFAVLQSTVDRNSATSVRAEAVALSDSRGHLRLYLPPPTESRPHNVTSIPQPGWDPVDVPCRTLSERLEEWGARRVDLMKIDVEGAEPRVLAGGAPALTDGVIRHIMIEVNGPRLTDGGSSPSDLAHQLQNLGFEPAVLRGRRAVPVPLESWDLDPRHEYDRLFVHRTALAG